MAARLGWLSVLGLTATLHVLCGCSLTKDSASQMGSLTGLSGEASASSAELPTAKAVQACLAVAQNLERASNDAEAIDQYEKILRLDPGNPKATRRLAVLYDRRCDYARADAEYQKLAKARPRDADLFNDWGYSFYQRNK